MAAAAPSPAAVGAAVNRFLDLCRANPNGLQQSVLDENTKDLDLGVVTQAINALLGKGHIQLFQQGGTLIYKEANKDEIAKFKGLSSEDMLVYQAIQQSANSGIWTMDLKRRTNLQQPQVTKAIKTLETRNLIKAVKSVEHKSRKVYMLFELEPSRDVTGGAFYTEQEFDVEFISVLKHQCLHFILRQDRRNWCRGSQLWRMWQIPFGSLESPKRNCVCKISSRSLTCWSWMEKSRKRLVAG